MDEAVRAEAEKMGLDVDELMGGMALMLRTVIGWRKLTTAAATAAWLQTSDSYLVVQSKAPGVLRCGFAVSEGEMPEQWFVEIAEDQVRL